MRCGTRVVATDCGVRVGTVVGHVWGSGELMVQWDGMKGTASVGKQTNLQIVGLTHLREISAVCGARKQFWKSG